MAEPAAGSTPSDGEIAASLIEALRASAPGRDFTRPPQPSGQRVTCALAPHIGRTSYARLLAGLAVLLGRHSRRESVVFSCRHHGAAYLVEVDVRPSRAFAAVVQDAQRALHNPVGALREATLATVGGVLLDLDGVKPLGAATEWTIRREALELSADADLYRQDSLPPLARQLAHLLAHAEDDSLIEDIEFFDASERERILRGFNGLRAPVPATATLTTLIAQQAHRSPEAVCVVHQADSLTFATLDAASNRLARLLAACGVGPGSFVALLDRRGLDFVIAMLAIWKAGGAYVPMDPGYPVQRVQYMLTDSDASVAIVGREALMRFGAALAACSSLRHVVCLQPAPTPVDAFFEFHGPADVAAQASAPLSTRTIPRNPAYMIYTSGSTGRPKGAIVRHDGAVNHLFAQAHALGAETIGRFLQSAPSSSDISVWQFAAPLVFGGTSVIVDDATDVAQLLAMVKRHDLHLIELVPVVLKYLIEFAAALPTSERALPSLRYAMVTGESATADLVNAWLQLFPEIPVVNAYGPTEAADDIAQAILTQPLPPRQVTVPIGKPLANLDLFVLDDRLRPLPVGAPGEICVAGVGVGDGYWRQPEKTSAAFVANPFVDAPGAAGPILYRTGDLGRWRDDGTLECLGRLDHQVQLRGQRIELPEVEAVLREHPTVADVVVQVFHDGQGDGRMVAFVVPCPNASADDTPWREHLAERLPAYMVPSVFVRLPCLPLNPAGKVDRQALVAPAPTAREAPNSRCAPRTELEALLARLWAQELGVGAVGIDDDFFALGGDSLAALAIAVGAREAGWHLRGADVLAYPTVRRLATVAQPVASAPPAPSSTPAGAGAQTDVLRALRPLDRAERDSFLAASPAWDDVRALTPSQQGLFLHWLLARDKRAYIDQLVYTLEGTLDADAFAWAWQGVVQRHRALRAAFLRSALSQPVQVIARHAEAPIAFIDLTALDESAQAHAWQAHCAREVEAGFDLARPPLMRLLVAQLGPRRHALAWTHHHLLLDGWSIAIVLRDVLALYAQATGHAIAPLPPPIDDSAWYEHLARVDLQDGMQYWRRTLACVQPAPVWRIATAGEATPGYGEADLVLPPTLTSNLKTLASRHQVTLGTLLQAAWAVLLARHTGRSDIVFGVVSSGREMPVPGIDAMVGLFVVTQPLRIDAASPLALPAWLVNIQAHASASRLHEAVPLAQTMRAAALPPGRPLFDTLFVLWNFPTHQVSAPEPLMVRATQFRTVPAYPLSLIAVPAPSLHLRLVYDRQHFDDDAAATLRATLHDALQTLARGGDPRDLP